MADRAAGRHAGGRAWHAAAPDDEGLVLGNLSALPDVLDKVDAVVSLCRVGTEDLPASLEHHEVWVVDQTGDDANPNLDLTLEDAAEAVATLRAEGKRVFLHCVGGRSRTPTVAALYLHRSQDLPIEEALERIATVAPYDPHNRSFREALQRAASRSGG